MANNTLWANLPSRITSELAEIQHLLPTYLHIILAALFPIYTAAHASLSRPASAATPQKKTGQKQEDATDEEDEADKSRMEGLSPQDAILFPLTAGAALTALYFLLKWDKELLNKLLSWYMSLGGLYGVVKFLSDSMHIVHSFIFPSYYSDGSRIWHINQKDRKAYHLEDESKNPKTTPLPGLLSKLPLPGFLLNFLWTVRGIPINNWTFKFYIHKFVAVRTKYDLYHCVALFVGTSLVYLFTFVTKPWYLTNLMGFAFSYTALQLISPTTFTTGSLVLAGLFVYDIYMVFFTPMMVTVAKNLDIPIKLLFPRPPGADPSAKRQYSMLGLGDIVLPGIVMGLALRFDLHLHYLYKQTSGPAENPDKASKDEKTDANNTAVTKAAYVSPSKNWSNHFWSTSRLGFALPESFKVPNAGQFSKVYFNASLVGYVLGMITTLAAMQLSDHPQPALLYLVPGVLIALWSTALARGELKLMWNFTEEEEDEKEKEQKSSEESKGADKQASETEKKDDAKSTARSAIAKVEELERMFLRDRRNELIFFSISRNASSAKENASQAENSERENLSSWVAPLKQKADGEPAGKRQKIA